MVATVPMKHPGLQKVQPSVPAPAGNQDVRPKMQAPERSHQGLRRRQNVVESLRPNPTQMRRPVHRNANALINEPNHPEIPFTQTPPIRLHIPEQDVAPWNLRAQQGPIYPAEAQDAPGPLKRRVQDGEVLREGHLLLLRIAALGQSLQMPHHQLRDRRWMANPINALHLP